MATQLDKFMTRDEQKLLGWLLVFVIAGCVLYYTGVTEIYAKRHTQEQSLQKATARDTLVMVDLRTATKEDLDILPGVGAKKAELILAYRQQHMFQSPEEVMNVKGFGAKTYLKLKPHLVIFGTPGAGVEDHAKLQAVLAAPDSVKQDTSPAVDEEHKSAKPSKAGNTALVNLNTASKEELMSLEGIGPKKADAILEYRHEIGKFTKLEQFMDVKGIGPKTFEKNKSRLRL